MLCYSIASALFTRTPSGRWSLEVWPRRSIAWRECVCVTMSPTQQMVRSGRLWQQTCHANEYPAAAQQLASFCTRNRAPVSADDNQSKRNVFLRKWQSAVSRGPSGGLKCWKREAKSLGWSRIRLVLIYCTVNWHGRKSPLSRLYPEKAECCPRVDTALPTATFWHYYLSSAGYLDTNFVILHFPMSPVFHNVFISWRSVIDWLICYRNHSDS
jgi:hypothetical protein